MTKPIELYYWPTPNGWKVSIALEEMALPYTLKPVNIIKGEQFAPAFLAISPNNRIPAIVDPVGPDGAPISVFESGAILQYLGRKTGKFYGPSDRERIAADEWIFWQMANLGPNFGQFGHFRNYAVAVVQDPAHVEYALKRFGNEVNRLLGVLERRLETHEYLTGTNYSIADIACWGWIERANRNGAIAQLPKTIAWAEKIGARPAVQRGFALRKELSETQPNMADNNSAETIEARKVLWGQTADSVADAAAKAKAG
jgi:glutathione S-transferase